MKNIRKIHPKSQKAVTLIALVITIIVLLILAGVSVAMLVGENGIITQARWASFVTEMKDVAEKVDLEAINKETQMYQLDDEEVTATLFTKKYDEANLSSTLKNEVEFLEGQTTNLYVVQLSDVKEDTYLYEPTIKVVFKIQGINIYGTTIHSIEYKNQCTDFGQEEDETQTSSNTVSMQPEYKNGYYEPNLDGFDANYTYIVYYSEDYTDVKYVSVEEYINEGRPQTIEDENGKYTFYDYKDTSTNANTSTWGNVKTYANGQEAWWVWIPRYSYDTTTISNKTGFDIKFTTVGNKVLDSEGKEIGTVGDGEYANYISHSGFTETYTDSEGTEHIVKELTGIWMSKYEPSVTTSFENNKETICYAPNLEGYDINYTYIITYDKDGTAEKNRYLLADMLKSGYKATEDGSLVSGEIDMSKIPDDEVWYDYGNQIWGNILTYANGLEAWWVWIPRYSYNIEGSSTGTSIVFVDTNDQPFESINDQLNVYQVHPGFNIENEDGTVKKLKGIWMSKYEPSETTSFENNKETKCYAPNLEGYDINNTYIVTYDKDGSAVKNKYLLADILKSGYEATKEGALISGEVDMSKIPDDEVWYDYGNQIWGNIVTTANNLEAWWVWIPRYSYNIEGNATGVSVVFVDLDDKPFETLIDTLGSYSVHPGFNLKDGTKLKGIWMSKYEPSGEPSNGDLDTPSISQ